MEVVDNSPIMLYTKCHYLLTFSYSFFFLGGGGGGFTIQLHNMLCRIRSCMSYPDFREGVVSITGKVEKQEIACTVCPKRNYNQTFSINSFQNCKSI